MRCLAVICLLFISAGLCGGQEPCPPDQDKWRYNLTPYIWGTGIEGDVAFKGNETSIDASFADITDNLDFGFMVHFEADKTDWGYFTDITYSDISADGESDGESVGFDSTMWIVEFAGARRLSGSGLTDEFGARKTDLIFGGRYWSIDNTLRLTDGNIGQDEDWVDPFVGVRYATPIGPRWAFSSRFDIGGFGVGSDFTWNLNLLFIYKSSSRGQFLAGYRILDVDRESGSGEDFFKWDVTMGGPVVGYNFRF